MSGAELRPIHRSPTFLSNRLSLILSGIVGGFGEGFMLPLVVISAYVLHLTSNLLVIGSVTAIAFGLRAAGTLASTLLLRSARRRKPWVFLTHLIRAAIAGLLAWLAWREGVADNDRLQTFLTAYGVFSFISGFAAESSNTLARTASEPENRSRMFDLRSIPGAGAGVIAGIVVHQVFNEGGQTLARSFASLYVGAAAAFAASAFFVLLVSDQPGRPTRNAPMPGGTVAHSRSMSAFRRFLLARLFLAAATSADVFLIVFAVLDLGMQADFLGYCAIGYTAALGAGLLFWRLRRAAVLSRSVLQIGAVLHIVPPLLVVIIPYLQDSAYYQERVTGNAVTHWMIVAAFATLGLSSASIATGSFAFVTSISPAMSQWFANAATMILAPVTLLGIGAGWIAREWGFDTLFAASLVISLLALLACGLLPVTAVRQHQIGAGIAGPAPDRPGSSRLLIR